MYVVWPGFGRFLIFYTRQTRCQVYNYSVNLLLQFITATVSCNDKLGQYLRLCSMYIVDNSRNVNL